MSEASNLFGICSDAGVVRDINEDFATTAVLWPNGQAAGAPVLFAAVADGMGGHAAGEVASHAAIETLKQAISAVMSEQSNSDIDFASALGSGFDQANGDVYRRGQQDADKRGMGTTLTAVLIHENHLCVGHVGDSRAYLIREAAIKQLTRDHSVVQEKLDAGLITAEEAAQSEERNQLRRVLGTRSSMVSDLICEDLQDGDALLLCTDGLHNSLRDQDLTGVIAGSHDPQSACENLVNLAKQRDGSDNITVVCIGIGRNAFHGHVPLILKAVKPRSRRILGLTLMIVLALMALVIVQIMNGNKGSFPGQQDSVIVREDVKKGPNSIMEQKAQGPSKKASQRRDSHHRHSRQTRELTGNGRKSSRRAAAVQPTKQPAIPTPTEAPVATTVQPASPPNQPEIKPEPQGTKTTEMKAPEPSAPDQKSAVPNEAGTKEKVDEKSTNSK